MSQPSGFVDLAGSAKATTPEIGVGMLRYAFVDDAIVNDRPVVPYGAMVEDGYRNAVVLDAIAQSAETGRRVNIAY